MMVWLAPGLSQGDTYQCKSCHLSFLVGDTRGEPSPDASEHAAPSQVDLKHFLVRRRPMLVDKTTNFADKVRGNRQLAITVG